MAKYEVIGDVYVGTVHYVGSPDGKENDVVELEPKAAANAVRAGNLRPVDAKAKKAAKDIVAEESTPAVGQPLDEARAAEAATEAEAVPKKKGKK